MKKGKMPQNCVAWTSMLMFAFLGFLLLALGLKMLFEYNATTAFMMGVGGKVDLGDQLAPLVNFLSQVVSYTWPFAATLIGLSFLTYYQKHAGIIALLVYMLFFALAHIWTGDMTAAIWDLLIALFVSISHSFCGMGMK